MPRPFLQRAGNLAARNNLYTSHVDAGWAQSEALLREAITALASGPHGLGERYRYLWHRSLIPFLAGMFVRGPEFATRHDARLEELGLAEFGAEARDNADGARIIERQRLLAPIMYADWDVVRFTSGPPLITSDVGYTLTRHAETGKDAYAVPLNRETALVLKPSEERGIGKLLFFDDVNEAESLNRATAANAVKEVYCATRQLAEAALEVMSAAEELPHAFGPFLFMGPHNVEELRIMETDRIRVGDAVLPWSEDAGAENILFAVRIMPIAIGGAYAIMPLPRAIEVSKTIASQKSPGVAKRLLWRLSLAWNTLRRRLARAAPGASDIR